MSSGHPERYRVLVWLIPLLAAVAVAAVTIGVTVMIRLAETPRLTDLPIRAVVQTIWTSITTGPNPDCLPEHATTFVVNKCQ